MLAAYSAVASLAYGFLLNLWFWPFLTSDSGFPPGLSFVPGAPVAENLQHWILFSLTTSLGFDLPRAALTVALVLVAGRSVLVALRRASRRAAFDAPVVFDRRRPDALSDMEILLLGTGAADGWPNPFCTCASCAWARGSGAVRTTTAALVDGVLLLDCGPDAPRQADRAGVGLAGLRAVLLTHAHPDHVAPEALLARSWARPDGALRVIGPQAALDTCRDWIGPDDAVTLEPVAAGDVVEVDGYVVCALGAAHDVGVDDLARHALVYDITAPDGRRLLYATDTGPLPGTTVEAVRGATYDVVLLEETFGRKADHGTGHLDLTSFPLELARLREVGAIRDDDRRRGRAPRAPQPSR